ncbi:MAG: hypothetical protein S4CHLAM81_12710 [Chlamydiales bacterium]|nr:hypothetical protein [Chlamydiales bacterium]MCH9636046.1 hypothetical protein [Chlamydiales bacterium]MCH9704186.1 hypothetical protein [Chlamydiota bacterium]
MQFTREPIIETIITPKDGYRLVVRPSHGSGEEFFVDMVEVISFNALSFYRSLDKPKSFVVPTSQYDVVEVREARMAIKSASVEKVKIAGGKKDDDEPSEKKSRKRTRKKKEESKEEKPKKETPKKETRKKEGTKEEAKKEEKEPVKRSLIPPPPTLISETMAKPAKADEPEKPADE